MARERVTINIEVNSDVATIEATRLALERLTNQNRELNDEYDKHTKRVQNVTKETNKLNKDNDTAGNTLRNVGKDLKTAKSRWKGFGEELFSFRKDLGSLISGFGGLIGLVNKLSLIEIPLLAAGLAGISLLFKSGTGFINMYRAAMSSMAYVAAGVGVAITTVLAALREFQSVGFGAQYYKGTENTTNRFAASSQAMKMFVDNTNLAIVGAESLGKAFGVLSKQAPVTGKTTAAFEGLMNVVAGQGGDLGKGAQSLAEFIAKVQKSGLGAAGAEAKALGPDFPKIIKEAQKLGIKTSDEFFKAAAEGTLGKTFQEKYAGQLDALNSTLIGRFKRSVAGVKAMLIDIGQEFLGPAKDAVGRLDLIVRRTILQLSPMLRKFGENTFIDKIVSVVDKLSNKFVYLMTKYLNTSPGIIQYFVNLWNKVSGLFERLQDWARQFKDAGQSLIDNFFGPLVQGIIDHFAGGINVLSDLVMQNGPQLQKFSKSLVDFIAAIGDYGNMVKEAFIAALPLLTAFVKGMTTIFKIFTSVAKTILNLFGKMPGGMGKAFAAIPVLYASLVLFSRFFKTFGSFFGKDMNVRANNVNINGVPLGAGAAGGVGPGGAGTVFARPNAFMSGQGGFISRGFAGRFPNAQLNYGNMSMMSGGMMLTAAGAGMGGTGGQLLTGLGNTIALGGVGKMLGGFKVPTIRAPYTGTQLMGGQTITGGQLATGLAAIPAAYTAADLLSTGIQNMPGLRKGTLGKDDVVGKLGMTAAGAGVGAAAGFGVGAAIGGPFSPITGAIGAVIGTVVGGITGFVKAGKYQKEARNAAKELMNNFDEAAADAFAAGDLQALADARSELLRADAENRKNLADTGTYTKALKELDSKLAAFDRKVQTFASNASIAEKYLGMSTDALNKLAEGAGINVQTQMLSLRDIIKLTGKSAADQARLIKAAWADINSSMLTGIMDKLQSAANIRTTGEAFNAEQMKFLGGAQNTEAIQSYITAGLNYSVAKYGTAGGIVNAFQSMTSAEQFKPGGNLYGMTAEKQKAYLAEVNRILNPATALAQAVTPDQMALLQNEVGFKGKTNEQILQMLIKELTADPQYLMNLQNAMATNSDFAVKNVTMPGGVTPGGGRGAYGPIVSAATPQMVNSNNTNNYSVVLPNGTILTPETLKKIEDHWRQMQREQEERGKTGAR